MPTSEPTVPTYEGRPLHHPDEPVVDQGLLFDMGTLLSRRRTLRLLGGTAGAALLAGCSSDLAPTRTATSGTTGAAAGDCDVDLIPEETAGPFPGDGSNGPDVLTGSGVVREDITTSFGDLTGAAEGVPCTIELTIQDADAGCAPYVGAAVYLWHADREGRYSLYSEGVTDQNYLRGVQACDDSGTVRFRSIFPGCYVGRWPHAHFEVFPSLEAATDVGNAIASSQLAWPEEACAEAYAAAGYETSAQSLPRLSLATDVVFAEDEGVLQLGSVTGSIEEGFTIRLALAVSAMTFRASVGGPGRP